MEQNTKVNKTANESQQLFSATLWQLREGIQTCLMEKNVGKFCNVFVKQTGNRLELRGNVDSEWTHREILALLPDEEVCLIDGIHVNATPVFH